MYLTNHPPNTPRKSFKYAGTKNGGSVKCPTGESIIWGYSYMYSKFENNDCFASNNFACVIGDETCEALPCTHEDEDSPGQNSDIIGRIVVLCGPNVIPDSYAKSQVITSRNADNIGTVTFACLLMYAL